MVQALFICYFHIILVGVNSLELRDFIGKVRIEDNNTKIETPDPRAIPCISFLILENYAISTCNCASIADKNPLCCESPNESFKENTFLVPESANMVIQFAGKINYPIVKSIRHPKCEEKGDTIYYNMAVFELKLAAGKYPDVFADHVSTTWKTLTQIVVTENQTCQIVQITSDFRFTACNIWADKTFAMNDNTPFDAARAEICITPTKCGNSYGAPVICDGSIYGMTVGRCEKDDTIKFMLLSHLLSDFKINMVQNEDEISLQVKKNIASKTLHFIFIQITTLIVNCVIVK